MTQAPLLMLAALVLTVTIGAVLAGLPMLFRLRRLLRDDARRDAAVRPWSMFEGDDA